MTNKSEEGISEMPHTGYNIPGQRRAYSSDGSSCRAISDNSSGNDSQEDSDKQKIDLVQSPQYAKTRRT